MYKKNMDRNIRYLIVENDVEFVANNINHSISSKYNISNNLHVLCKIIILIKTFKTL